MRTLWMAAIAIFLTGCATEPKIVHTPPEYIYFIPNKVALPAKPIFEKYDRRYGLDHPTNFTRFQRNAVLSKNYTNSLYDIIAHYEKEIDEMTAKKESLQKQKSEVE